MLSFLPHLGLLFHSLAQFQRAAKHLCFAYPTFYILSTRRLFYSAANRKH